MGLATVATTILRRLLREGHQLTLCKMSLAIAEIGSEDRTPDIIFELWVQGELRGSIKVPAREIGVPLSYADAKNRQHSEEGYRLPPTILDFGRSVLSDREPLYLAFELPYGYLPAVPWERLISAELNVPMLRLGTLAVNPVRPKRAVEIAYCCSLPRDYPQSPQDLVEDFFARLPRDLPRRARLHLFADRELQTIVRERLEKLGAWESVRIYPPSDAERYVGPRGSGTEMLAAEELENPWLLWIRDSLKDLSIDAVHFVCPGYLGRGRAGLQFANCPGDNMDYAWSRLVGARQLALFLEQVGAWTAVATVLPERGSVLGLRMLFDEMTRMVIGPVVLHDPVTDDAREALRQAYHFIFAPESGQVPKSPALSIVTNPWWLGSANHQHAAGLEQLIRKYTLQDKVEGLSSEEDTPAWLTAQQRRFEKAVARIAGEPKTEKEHAEQSGRLEALNFASDLIAKLAKTGQRGSQ